MTDPLGQSQVLPYLLGLAKAGYRIFLLSCEKEEPFRQHKHIIEDLVNNTGIVWTPIAYTKRPPVLSTMLDISKMRRAAKKIHQQHGISLVHTRPGVPALVGLWMKKKYGISFLNDIRDFYADSRVDGFMWNLKNPLYKTVYNFFKRKEAEQIKLNDGIVTLTYAAEKVVRQLPEFKSGTPLEVIPCSADLDLFNPASISETQKEAVKQRFGIQPGDTIITYLGSVGGLYLTDEMMQFCKVAHDKIPHARFLFISPGRHEAIAAAAVKQGIAKEKLIITKAARKEVPLYLSLSNFSVFFIRPCFSRKAQSPTKHGEIMAMGIPVITNRDIGDVEEIITKYQSGLVISAFTDAAYEAAVDNMIARNNYDPVSIRHGAVETYALSAAIEKYKRIYQALLSG